MPTFYSAQLTQFRAARRSQPNEVRGKVRTLYWSFTGDAAQNDIVGLTIIRKGERVLSGLETHSALGASVTGTYGTYPINSDGLTLNTTADDADRFLAATAHAAAGSTVIANTQALFFGWEATDDFFVAVLLAGADPASGTLTGHLMVAKD